MINSVLVILKYEIGSIRSGVYNDIHLTFRLLNRIFFKRTLYDYGCAHGGEKGIMECNTLLLITCVDVFFVRHYTFIMRCLIWLKKSRILIMCINATALVSKKKKEKGHLLYASGTSIDWYGSDLPSSLHPHKISEHATVNERHKSGTMISKVQL